STFAQARPAAKLRVADCVAHCVWFTVRRPTEWQPAVIRSTQCVSLRGVTRKRVLCYVGNNSKQRRKLANLLRFLIEIRIFAKSFKCHRLSKYAPCVYHAHSFADVSKFYGPAI